MRSFAATVGLLFAGAEAGSHRGSCQDQAIPGVSSFSQSRIAGRWFEIARDSIFSDPTKSCLAEDHVVNFDGTLSISKNDYTLEDGWTQDIVNAILQRNKPG